MSHSARRLNTISKALDCKTYLEIGVATGYTILKVDVPSRTGVDPHFAFDWRQEMSNANGSLYLQQCTSDKFFETLDPSIKYDLIFIDGLHTYEQTYRDIINALLHSHPRTVILIDDTVPSDVFSTSRDPQECVDLRFTFSEKRDSSWHGDTYKVVPLIRLFNPHYNLSTIVTDGNPQTLLWKADKLNAPDGHSVVENLASADYMWFLRNRDLYDMVTEERGLDLVITDLKIKG
jgi:hypothetical protein